MQYDIVIFFIENKSKQIRPWFSTDRDAYNYIFYVSMSPLTNLPLKTCPC